MSEKCPKCYSDNLVDSDWLEDCKECDDCGYSFMVDECESREEMKQQIDRNNTNDNNAVNIWYSEKDARIANAMIQIKKLISEGITKEDELFYIDSKNE